MDDDVYELNMKIIRSIQVYCVVISMLYTFFHDSGSYQSMINESVLKA